MDTSQITEEDYLRMTPEQQEQYMIRQQQLMAQPSKPIHAPPSTYSDQDGYSPSPGATIDGKLDAASAKAAVQRLALADWPCVSMFVKGTEAWLCCLISVRNKHDYCMPGTCNMC